MSSLSDINRSLQEQTGVLSSIKDDLEKQRLREERSRLDQLEALRESRARSAGSTRQGTLEGQQQAAAGAGRLGLASLGLGVGLAAAAKGIAGLGLALPAFFGGLLAGSEGLEWLQDAANLDYSGLKRAAIGFTDMILEIPKESFAALAGIMAVSAIGGTRAALGVGTMGFAISAFLGGLLAGDALFEGVSSLGADLDFGSLKTMLAGFSSAIGELSPEAAASLAGILGGAAALGRFTGPRGAVGILTTMSAIGAGISGFMIGLKLGDVGLSWLDGLGPSGGLVNAMTMFKDSIGALDVPSITALTAILGAGTALGAIIGTVGTPLAALAAGAGIFAIMTSIGFSISGLMLGLKAGDVGLSWIDTLTGSTGGGLANAMSRFSDMIMSITPEAIDRMALISQKNIGSGLGSLSAGIVAFLGAQGLVNLATTWDSIKDGLTGVFDFMFGTSFQEQRRSPIEQILDSLEPLEQGGDEKIAMMDRFGGAIGRFSQSMETLANINTENTSANLTRMIADMGGVLELLPYLLNGGTYRSSESNRLSRLLGTGRGEISFGPEGGGLRNLASGDLELIAEGVNSLRSALNGGQDISGNEGTIERLGGGAGEQLTTLAPARTPPPPIIINQNTIDASSNSTGAVVQTAPPLSPFSSDASVRFAESRAY